MHERGLGAVSRHRRATFLKLHLSKTACRCGKGPTVPTQTFLLQVTSPAATGSCILLRAATTFVIFWPEHSPLSERALCRCTSPSAAPQVRKWPCQRNAVVLGAVIRCLSYYACSSQSETHIVLALLNCRRPPRRYPSSCSLNGPLRLVRSPSEKSFATVVAVSACHPHPAFQRATAGRVWQRRGFTGARAVAGLR